jgi:hypothetical protein
MIQYVHVFCISLNSDVSVLLLQNMKHLSKQAHEKNQTYQE